MTHVRVSPVSGWIIPPHVRWHCRYGILVIKDPDRRAIAGLYKGCGEGLMIGFNHTETIARIGTLCADLNLVALAKLVNFTPILFQK